MCLQMYRELRQNGDVLDLINMRDGFQLKLKEMILAILMIKLWIYIFNRSEKYNRLIEDIFQMKCHVLELLLTYHLQYVVMSCALTYCRPFWNWRKCKDVAKTEEYQSSAGEFLCTCIDTLRQLIFSNNLLTNDCLSMICISRFFRRTMTDFLEPLLNCLEWSGTGRYNVR